MKKILVIYIVFVAALLFYFSYDSYNLINYGRITNIFNKKIDDLFVCEIDIKNIEIKQEFAANIIEFLDEKNVEAVLKQLTINEDGTMLYNSYLYAKDNDWIYDTMRMTSGDKIDFLEFNDSQAYLSSDFNDKDAVGTFSSYDNTYFMHENEIYRFFNVRTSLNNISNESLSVYLNGYDEAEQLSSFLNDKFKKDINSEVRELHGGTEADWVSAYKQTEIMFALVSSFAVMSLMLICIIMKDKREILIRRMNGENPLYICNKLYLRTLLLGFVVFVVTVGIIWLIFIGQWDKYYIELFNDIKQFSLYAFLSIPCLLILSGIYVYYTIDIRELKNSQSLRMMNYINYLFKIGMSLFLIVPFITSINAAIPHLNKYQYVTSHENEIKQYWRFAFSEATQEEMNEIYQNCLYVDMTDYSHMSEIDMIMKPRYEGVGELMSVPLVKVNDQHLKDYIIYNLNNQIIDISKLPENTMLIPEQYQNTELTPSRAYQGENKVFVKDTGKHYNLQIRESIHVLDNPIVMVIHEYNSSDVAWDSMYFKAETDQEYHEIRQFIDNITQKPYRLFNTTADINNYLVNTQQIFMEIFGKIFIYGFVYMLFAIQFMTLYIQEERKEMSLQYMAGKNRWDRYGNIYLINLCIYLCIILLGVIWQGISFEMCLKFSIMGFIFDSILMTLFIRRFEKKSIVLSLKGEY